MVFAGPVHSRLGAPIGPGRRGSAVRVSPDADAHADRKVMCHRSSLTPENLLPPAGGSRGKAYGSR